MFAYKFLLYCLGGRYHYPDPQKLTEAVLGSNYQNINQNLNPGQPYSNVCAFCYWTLPHPQS